MIQNLETEAHPSNAHHTVMYTLKLLRLIVI